MNIRTYSELSKLRTFKERYEYLKLSSFVGEDTFGYDRYLNQQFYKSIAWKRVRDQVIIRDNGCDLGIDDRYINSRIYVHHMNPITKSDIINLTEYLLNPEYLICVSKNTHDAIHYGSEELLYTNHMVERRPNDTCPWR
ncbi:MAG: hypothetical protein SPH06_04255 [Erysipelotrichaceae bacterium]|nr:hypothetical protein [Erysipelotrichaceae bacterium]